MWFVDVIYSTLLLHAMKQVGPIHGDAEPIGVCPVSCSSVTHRVASVRQSHQNARFLSLPPKQLLPQLIDTQHHHSQFEDSTIQHLSVHCIVLQNEESGDDL